MSVRLDQYCVKSQSKMAKALKLALDKQVFVCTDELVFTSCLDHVVAYISVCYQLSMLDVKNLLEIFSGFYWKIEPTSKEYTYQIVISLKSNEI